VARGILGPIERLREAAAASDMGAAPAHTGLPETDALAARLHEAATARRDARACLQDLAATLEARVVAEVAAREAVQAQAAAGERLRALGRLAGGIAHDFNNVLQTVAAVTHLLGLRRADQAMVERATRLLGNASRHGAAITARLLGFARRDPAGPPVPLSLRPVLAELREMLAATLGARIQLTTEVAEDLPKVLTDRSMLETVLINLAVNARDAMPQGGTLTFGAALASHLPEGLAQGRYVELAVADTGIGMAPELLARVTEPFFTTKPAGKGTGLGLAMAHGFAEQFGGMLKITSEPGMGTTVRLWLPAEAA
jgi:signal transduction histidine kinase